MSLDLVESRVAAGEYKSCAEFDQDMSRLFEKARRWHPVASPSYADILILQVRLSLLPFPPNLVDSPSLTLTLWVTALLPRSHVRQAQLDDRRDPLFVRRRWTRQRSVARRPRFRRDGCHVPHLDP